MKSLDLMWLVHLEFFSDEFDELVKDQEKRRQPSGDDCKVEPSYSLNWNLEKKIKNSIFGPFIIWIIRGENPLELSGHSLSHLTCDDTVWFRFINCIICSVYNMLEYYFDFLDDGVC